MVYLLDDLLVDRLELEPHDGEEEVEGEHLAQRPRQGGLADGGGRPKVGEFQTRESNVRPWGMQLQSSGSLNH